MGGADSDRVRLLPDLEVCRARRWGCQQGDRLSKVGNAGAHGTREIKQRRTQMNGSGHVNVLKAGCAERRTVLPFGAKVAGGLAQIVMKMLGVHDMRNFAN